jgi:hypothetical protein
MQKKTLVLSAVIALAAGSLAIGGVYALFTSNASNEIAVTAGKVSVKSAITLVSGASLDQELTPSDNAIAFVNGGSAKIVNGNIVLDKVTPGDKITFKLAATNESNVAIKYRTVMNASGDLMKGLTVKAVGADLPTVFPYWTDWTHADAGAAITDAASFVVELPKEAGNEYQEKSAVIKISLSAIQGNADVVDFKVDDAAKTAEIGSVYGWLDFAGKVNAGTTYAGYTVTLKDDLDFSEVGFVSATNTAASYPSYSFSGIFDGNGKTMSNIALNVVNAAGNSIYGEFNATGVFGTLNNATVENLTVASSSFAGTRWTGAIAGYIGQGGSTISNCAVKDSSVKVAAELLGSEYDNGDKVGGIVGYASAGNTIENCTVTNLTAQAYRDIGGIVGYCDGTLTNDTVTTATLTQDLAHDYKGYGTTAKEYVHEIVGRGSPTMTGCTFTGVTIA